jgi:hypothetical protein
VNEDYRAELERRMAELVREHPELANLKGPLPSPPSPYSRFAPLRAVQVILDWYLAPTLALIAIAAFVVAVWVWVIVG